MATEAKRRAPATRPARRRGAERTWARAHETAVEHAAPGRAHSDAPARERLLAAADALIATAGYEEMTVSAVCERAGLSRQTFYTHFADKRELCAALCEPELAGLESQLRAAERAKQAWTAPVAHALEQALAERFGSPQSPRSRLVTALEGIVAARGYAVATIPAVSRSASLSVSSFYAHFDSLDACLSAVVAAAVGRIEAGLATAGVEDEEVAAATGGDGVSGADDDVDRDPAALAETALAALLDRLAADPDAARILLVEAGALTQPPADGGPAEPGLADPAPGWAGSLRELVERRVLGGFDSPEQRDARRIAAGGIVAVLRHAYLEDDLAALPSRHGELLAAAVAPLAGAAAAPALA